jgi:ketosteroid isomerase-like protein
MARLRLGAMPASRHNRKIGQATPRPSLHLDRMTNAHTPPQNTSSITGQTLHPSDAVTAWWTAIQSNDLTALRELLAEDYIVSGGPEGRTIGRQDVLDQAAAFSADATIDDWTISAIELRVGTDHAVCSYRWDERGTHAGTPFMFSGLATDVLHFEAGTWRHQARHVSMLANPTDDTV